MFRKHNALTLIQMGSRGQDHKIKNLEESNCAQKPSQFRIQNPETLQQISEIYRMYRKETSDFVCTIIILFTFFFYFFGLQHFIY